MRKYKKEEIKQLKEIENGIICDICKKTIRDENDYKSEFRTRMSHFYEVSTHHNDWGNDSIESYQYYDICSEECLFKFLNKYFNGEDATLCCEIEEIRI